MDSPVGVPSNSEVEGTGDGAGVGEPFSGAAEEGEGAADGSGEADGVGSGSAEADGEGSNSGFCEGGAVGSGDAVGVGEGSGADSPAVRKVRETGPSMVVPFFAVSCPLMVRVRVSPAGH